MRYLWVAALSFLLISSALAGTVYKCKGTDDELHYQETPCANDAQSVSSWQSHGGGDVEVGSDGSGNAALVLGQGRGGHYFVDGSINDQYVNFLIDTGASFVTIPLSLASAAGLKCQKMSATQTANGITQSCIAVIQKLTFGRFTLRYVDATIVPNLSQPLLGMNVLKRFHVEQNGDQMHISKNY